MLTTPSLITLILFLLVLIALFACAYLDVFAPTPPTTESFWSPTPTDAPYSPPSNCPSCEWKCDEAECPQDCHSECAPPQCTIKCKPLAPARCTVKCSPPRCRNVCPDDGKCLRGDCNLCHSVCDPPECKVTCVAPTPECVTQCAPPNCKRVCVAPSNCAKPVCRMVCEAMG